MRAQILWILLICAVLSACHKVNLLPDLEGNMVGFVNTFDEFSNQLQDRSDVLVSAEGSEGYTAYTDKAGRFEFIGLPNGTYELVFTKAGFDTLKRSGIKHLGGTPTILGTFSIYQTSKTQNRR